MHSLARHPSGQRSRFALGRLFNEEKPVHQTHRLVLALLTWTLAAVGCSGSQAAPAKPRACTELATQLCEGAAEEVETCRSTLTLLPHDACTSALAHVASSKQKLTARRKKCTDLVAKLCSDLGEDSEGCAMAKESSSQLTYGRCEAMLREYPEVVAELKRQDEQHKPLPADMQAKLAAMEAPALGPVDARVTVVAFSDFECPFCSRAAQVMHAIHDKYGDKVRVVFRQYPLSFHEHAQLSAEAALAAHAQGKFWALHDKLFAHQDKLDRPALESYAREIGIDVADFAAALDQERYKSVVQAELDLGDQVNVDGTPTMFVNGRRVSDPTNVEHVSRAIDAALAKVSS